MAGRFLWHAFHLPVQFYGLRTVGDMVARYQSTGQVSQLLAQSVSTNLLNLVMVVFFGLLLFLFNSLEKKILIRPLTGLWELYELLTTVPGYILSYLRLFALGLAGALLGETTIKLAEMVRGHSWVGIVLMVLVFLLGSLINFAIGLLSAFVHSLRLTFVEFYNSLGFKGGGVSYEPFEFKS